MARFLFGIVHYYMKWPRNLKHFWDNYWQNYIHWKQSLGLFSVEFSENRPRTTFRMGFFSVSPGTRFGRGRYNLHSRALRIDADKALTFLNELKGSQIIALDGFTNSIRIHSFHVHRWETWFTKLFYRALLSYTTHLLSFGWRLGNHTPASPSWLILYLKSCGSTETTIQTKIQIQGYSQTRD